jgi:hypothetical protein
MRGLKCKADAHMDRKRVTQIFPFLLLVRGMQRKMCFYVRMRFDGRHYAETIDGKQLPYKLFEAGCALYNVNTGKVFNLKLTAKTLNGLLIRLGETLSFWRLGSNEQSAVLDVPHAADGRRLERLRGQGVSRTKQ